MANLSNLANVNTNESRVPEAYTIDSIMLRNHNGEIWDIQKMVTDFTITESIYHPGLILSLNVKDTVNFMEDHRLTGHETITVNLSRKDFRNNADTKEQKEYPEIAQKISRMFYVTEYPLYGKFDNRVQVYTLKGVSKHIFLSKFKKVSRAYTGNIADFIKDVFVKDLDVDEKNIVLSKQSSPPVSFIVPNLTPIDAIQWAIRHCYDSHGSPWYCYENLNGQIAIESHTDVNTRAKEKEYREFREGKFFSAEPGTLADFHERANRILDLTSDIRMSKFLSGMNGAYASKSIYTDIFNKSISTEEFNYKTEFSKMAKIGNYSSLSQRFYPDRIEPANIYTVDTGAADLSGQLNQTQFLDRALAIKSGAHAISEFSDADINYIPMNSGAYGTSSVNYHNPTKNKFINIAQSINENLEMMVHDFSVAGDLELNCGKIVLLSISPSSDPGAIKKNNNNVGGSNPLHDEFFSGKYIVASVIHKFAETYFCDVRVKTDAFAYNLLK